MNYNPILIVAGEPNSIFLEIFFKVLKKNKILSPLILITSHKKIKMKMKKLKFKKKIKLLFSLLLEKYKLDNKSINLINVEYNTNKAFEKMMSGKPGPVHLQIPIDVMAERMPEIKGFHYKKKKPLAPKLSEILTISNAINNSKKPCIIVGGGARSAKRNIRKFSRSR